MSRTRFKAGDPFTIECARRGGLAGGFRFNSETAKAAGRKGRQASPYNRIPLNRNAKRTLRLALIQKIARKSP